LRHSASERLLPDGIQVGGEDFAVAAYDGDIEIESGGRDHSVGHVWNFCAWDLAHGLHNRHREDRFSEDVFGIGDCAEQFIVSRLGKAILLDKIDQLNQGDGGDGDFLSCEGGLIDEGSGTMRKTGDCRKCTRWRCAYRQPRQTLKLFPEVAEHLCAVLVNFFRGGSLAEGGASSVAGFERLGLRRVGDGWAKFALDDGANVSVDGNAMRVGLHLECWLKLLRQFNHHGGFLPYL